MESSDFKALDTWKVMNNSPLDFYFMNALY